MSINYEELVQLALFTRQRAYAPYSNFKVGAALLCKNGKIYTGCNIENHGIQAICGERTAFAKAISEGETEFESIAVVGAKKGEELNEECLPCGYCRQFMTEFVEEDFFEITNSNLTTSEKSKILNSIVRLSYHIFS